MTPFNFFTLYVYALHMTLMYPHPHHLQVLPALCTLDSHTPSTSSALSVHLIVIYPYTLIPFRLSSIPRPSTLSHVITVLK